MVIRLIKLWWGHTLLCSEPQDVCEPFLFYQLYPVIFIGFYLADVHSELICKCHWFLDYTKLFSSLFSLSDFNLKLEHFAAGVCFFSLLSGFYLNFLSSVPGLVFGYCSGCFLFSVSLMLLFADSLQQPDFVIFWSLCCVGTALCLGEFYICILICYGQYFLQWSVLFTEHVNQMTLGIWSSMIQTVVQGLLM